MGAQYTVANIVADIARLANVPAFSASTHVTSGAVTYWLSQSARALSALYLQKFSADLDYIRSVEMATVPGLNLVSLPEDCHEVHAVLWAKTATDYRLLGAQADVSELENIVDEPTADWGEKEPRYRLEGATIAFYPASAVAERLLVMYTTHLNLDGATTFLSRLDCDRWLTLDVLCKVLSAKQRDPSMFVQEKLLLQQDMFSRNRSRLPNATHTIRRVGQRTVTPYWRRGG